jgi:hypothetical protein
MKKGLLLFVFSIMSFSAFSQLIVRTYKNQAGTYDDIFKKWRFDEMNYSEISIVVEKRYFQFDDKAQSLYRVIEKQGENVESAYKSTTWMCKDERNINCTVQIIHYFENKSNVFAVIYDKICYVYHIREVEQNK